MKRMQKRLEALEVQNRIDDPALIAAVMERETDLAAWMFRPGSDARELDAVWAHVLADIDGRTRGLPSERKI